MELEVLVRRNETTVNKLRSLVVTRNIRVLIIHFHRVIPQWCSVTINGLDLKAPVGTCVFSAAGCTVNLVA